METPLVTISLKEYNDLKRIKDEIKEAFDDKKAILLSDYMGYGMGGPRYEFKVINLDDLASVQSKEIKRLTDRNSELFRENQDLKYANDKRKQGFWYKLFGN